MFVLFTSIVLRRLSRDMFHSNRDYFDEWEIRKEDEDGDSIYVSDR